LAPARATRLGCVTAFSRIKLINRLLDGFEGKLTTAKWAAIAKCSTDTALRDISELLARGVLRKLEGGGRSTGYELSK
jgi:Fic family protein